MEVFVVEEVVFRIGVESGSCPEVQHAQSWNLLLPLGVKLPAFVVEVRLQHALDGSFVVDGEERPPVEPGEELQSQHRCEASVAGGHIVLLHGGLVEGFAVVVDDTRLDIKPVEHHDVVEYLQVGVLEFVEVGIVEVDAVGIFFLECLLHAGVTDGVAITPDDLCITIALRVVGHSQGGCEVELLLTEVITEGGVERQIAVLVPGVTHTEFHLVTNTTACTITQVEGIDDG